MSSSTRPPLPGSPAPSAEAARGRPARAWVGRRDDGGAARRDEAFDALTDLFIGEAAGYGPSHDARPGPARPVLRLAVDEPAASDVDAQAGDDEKTGGPASIVLGDPVVESVSTGNLPVLASAWASQYAREIAAAAGRPVAVLRVQAGFASLELVGRWPGVGADQADVVAVTDDLASAIALAATRTDRWIVRCTPQEQAELLDLGLIRVLTLLTGADETASAAAAQAAEAVRAGLDAAGAGTPAVRVAVMGVVSDADRQAGRGVVEAVRERLGDGHVVQPVVCSSRITSARAPVSLFSGPTDQSLRATALLLARTIGVATPTPALRAGEDDPPAAPSPVAVAADPAPGAETSLGGAGVAPADTAARALSGQELTLDEDALAAPALADPPVPAPGPVVEVTLDELPLPEAPASSVPTQTPRADVVVAAGPAALMPWVSGGPGADPESDAVAPTGWAPASVEVAGASATVAAPPIGPAHAASSVAPAPGRDKHVTPDGALAAHVPGLSAMTVRCPYAAGVELGVDDAGSLHLLARQGVGGVDGAVSELLAAGAWARDHASLLGLRLGTHGPTLHVFTDEPARVRRLLDTDVRVHLLASVGVNGTTAWVCRPLN